MTPRRHYGSGADIVTAGRLGSTECDHAGSSRRREASSVGPTRMPEFKRQSSPLPSSRGLRQRIARPRPCDFAGRGRVLGGPAPFDADLQISIERVKCGFQLLKPRGVIEPKKAIHLFAVRQSQPSLKLGAGDPVLSDRAIERNFQRGHDRQKREVGVIVAQPFPTAEYRGRRSSGRQALPLQRRSPASPRRRGFPRTSSAPAARDMSREGSRCRPARFRCDSRASPDLQIFQNFRH